MIDIESERDQRAGLEPASRARVRDPNRPALPRQRLATPSAPLLDYCYGTLAGDSLDRRHFLLAGSLSGLSSVACGARDALWLAVPRRLNHAAEGASLTNLARGGGSWANHMAWGDGKFASLATNGASVNTMLARAASFDALFDDSLPPGCNVAWFWCEAPEIGLDGGGNLPALEQHVATWVAGRARRGWTTVIKTVIPCGLSLGFEAARGQVNAWIRSGASRADVIDDWAAIWPGDGAAFPSLFDSDLVHTSSAGAELGVSESSAAILARLELG